MSPETPADPAHFATRQIVLKFVEGAGARLRAGRLVSADKSTRARLGRAGLEDAAAVAEISALQKLVESLDASVERATADQIGESDLDRLRKAAERSAERELADLNAFFFVHIPEMDPERAADVLRALRQFRVVEVAYFQPLPFDAADIPPTTTIDVTNNQGFFRRASAHGIDVDFARRFSGGRGDDMRIADIEAGWHLDHEDLPKAGFGFGVNFVDSHGTAVLGEIAALDNGFGAVGIAPNATIGWSSVTNLSGQIYFYSVGNALLMALFALRPGDIALIEQHFPTSAGACPNTCNCGQFGFVAVETFPYEHAAISQLTGAGVVVVEAAGNGQQMVVPASTIDSGAIIVGASNGRLASGVPACFTNWGPRVDVHAWGGSIGTLGYGGIPGGSTDATLRANGADEQQWYTRAFGGTSGASPIVVGAAALIQSTRAARRLPRLNSVAMRALLVSTGTPQRPGSAPAVGVQPDLRRATSTYVPDSARFISIGAPQSGAVAPGSQFHMTVTVENSGGSMWEGSHSLKIAPSFASGVQEFTGNATLLGDSAPQGPGDQTSHDMIVTAPNQIGSYSLAFEVRDPSGLRLAVSQPQSVAVAPPNSTFDNATATIVSAPGSLHDGQSSTVTVAFTNTGSSTWSSPGHHLQVYRFNRISLPKNNFALPSATPPGGTSTFEFDIKCNGTGTGWFDARMFGPNGQFGQSAGRNIVCQP